MFALCQWGKAEQKVPACASTSMLWGQVGNKLQTQLKHAQKHVHLQMGPADEREDGIKDIWMGERSLLCTRPSSHIYIHKRAPFLFCADTANISPSWLSFFPFVFPVLRVPWIMRLFQRLEDLLETESLTVFTGVKKKKKSQFPGSSLPLTKSLCMGDGGERSWEENRFQCQDCKGLLI